MNGKKIILVDMDGVLADFETSFLEKFREKFDRHQHIPKEERKMFYVHEEYPEEIKEEVRAIYAQKNFFLDLPEIRGGREAVFRMKELGHEVFICTSPIRRYENCVIEKYKWIEAHFGYDWTKKIIMTKDKTLVYGDFLIDDRPHHTGVREPSWEHILYDAPYNKNVHEKRRLTWDNWEEVLKL